MFNLQAGWVSEEAGGSLNALEDISIHRKPNSNPGAGVEQFWTGVLLEPAYMSATYSTTYSSISRISIYACHHILYI